MVKKVKRFFQKNAVLILSILFLVLFSGAIKIFAADPPPTPGSGGYAPGTILDPGCAPGSSADCTVNIGESFTIDADGNMFAGTGAVGGTENFFAGIDAGKFNTGGYNVGIGYQTLYSNAGGANNVAIGWKSLFSNTIGGGHNVAVGMATLYSNTTGSQNIANGYYSLYSNTTGNGNTATGHQTLWANTTGAENLASGFRTLESNTTGSYNTASGASVLFNNTTGYANTANGYHSLYSNTTGFGNTADGYQALYSNVGGHDATAVGYRSMYYANSSASSFANYNVAVGYEALRGSNNAAVNIGNYNTVLGYQSIFSNTSGHSNVGIGYQTLYSNAGGDYNTVIGRSALYSNLEGNSNVAIGTRSLYFNTTGSSNVANGDLSLYSNTIGASNVANGWEALYANDTGGGNVAIGYQAGYTNITANANVSGSYNVFIGHNSGPNTPTQLDNAIAIGKNAFVGASNSMVLGGTGADAVKVGIGTTTPTNVLDVVGKLGDTTVMSISTTGGNTCTFNTGSNPGVWSCASDRRLKNNISAIDNNLALTKINELNPVMFHYNWQDSSDPLVPGFIAQEFEEIFPDMVSTNPETGYKSLSYTPLIPYTVRAIQELDLKVEDLIIEKQNLFSNLISWFGNVENGIEKLFVKEISTDKICIKKSDGVTEVCITGDELDQILSNSGSSGFSSGTDSVPDSEPTQEPSCSDSIQNQDETGIDTGGVCDVSVVPELTPEVLTETVPEI